MSPVIQIATPPWRDSYVCPGPWNGTVRLCLAAKGVRDPPHPACFVDQNDVESDPVSTPVRMFGQQNFGGSEQPCALLAPECISGVGETGALLNLHKSEQAGLLGNRIYFACFRAKSPAEHLPSIVQQGSAGK